MPELSRYDAVLFDLDGVLTPTAELHRQAWRRMFTAVFQQWGITPEYSEDDYFQYLDGKKRYDGVDSLLRSRNVELPWGDPSDAPELDTVCGIGNRKNKVFSELLDAEGIQPYPGSLELVVQLKGRGIPMAIVSSSQNAERVLAAAGIRDYFAVVVDGAVAQREGIPSKPAPDMFLRAAALLHADPARAVVLEDAVSGVAAAAAGSFGIVIGVDRGAGAGMLRAAGASVVVEDLKELVQ